MPQDDNPDVESLDMSYNEFRFLKALLLCAAYFSLTWSAVWEAHPRSYHAWNFSYLVVFAVCAFGPLVAAARSAYLLKKGHEIESEGLNAAIKALIFIPTALLLPFMTGVTASGIGTFSSAPFLIGLFAIMLVIAIIVFEQIASRLPRPAQRWKYEPVMHGMIIASVVGPIVGLPLWSLANIPLVGVQAKLIAGTQPYCIQVPKRSSFYQPVRSWSEFAGLRMLAPFEDAVGATTTSRQWSFHAVLVVMGPAQKEFYNWSYEGWGFVPISDRVRSLTHVSAECTPQRGFLYTLDLFRGAGSSG